MTLYRVSAEPAERSPIPTQSLPQRPRRIRHVRQRLSLLPAGSPIPPQGCWHSPARAGPGPGFLSCRVRTKVPLRPRRTWSPTLPGQDERVGDRAGAGQQAFERDADWLRGVDRDGVGDVRIRQHGCVVRGLVFEPYRCGLDRRSEPADDADADGRRYQEGGREELASSAIRAAIAAAPAPASSSSVARESSSIIQNDIRTTHQASQAPTRAVDGRCPGSRSRGSPASGPGESLA